MIPSVSLAYGKTPIPLALDPEAASWHVIAPHHAPALADPRAALTEACRNPIACDPLRNLVKPSDQVVIVTADNTRPVPNRFLIPAVLEELGIAKEQVTVLLGTGTHRAVTPAEKAEMFGEDLLREVRVVNHDAYDPSQLVVAGYTASGVPVTLNRQYVEADFRVVLGFIEPHFFAGFSGGAKGVAPGVAGLESILALHAYDLIDDPKSTWGELDENPVHWAIVQMAGCCPPDFLINVTLNRDKAITGVFAGEYRRAHRMGCAQSREEAMAPVTRRFPVLVTTNSGYPLDQNLYQSVKGMSAAARILEPDGAIFIAAECRDGIPDHGNFGAMLSQSTSREDLEASLRGHLPAILDQWQVQVLLRILRQGQVYIHSSLPPNTVRACGLIPIDDLAEALYQYLQKRGGKTPVAVLPEGPLSIPYVC